MTCLCWRNEKGDWQLCDYHQLYYAVENFFALMEMAQERRVDVSGKETTSK